MFDKENGISMILIPLLLFRDILLFILKNGKGVNFEVTMDEFQLQMS